MFRSAKQKGLSYIVFAIYLILLVWLVIFKFVTSLSELPHIRGINLIPFYYDVETGIHLKEVLYNIIVFIPLGVYAQVFGADRKPWVKCLVFACVSLLFEVIQFIFAIGASDITDLMGNTLGGAFGILLCVLMKKLAPRKFISVINALGVTIEIAAIGLLLLLLAAN